MSTATAHLTVSGIGTVPVKAASGVTGIARDCSTTNGCAMMARVP